MARQSLPDHSLAVASVFAELLRLPVIRRRLAEAAGGAELTPILVARLCWLVYLHDAGKVSQGFQARIRRGAPMVGHIKPMAALFGRSPDPGLEARVWKAFRVEEVQKWGNVVLDIWDAVLSHHGAPWPVDEIGARQATHWRTTPEYDPFAALESLAQEAAVRYPAAFDPPTEALPLAAEFHHAVAGLVQAADWIGSSQWEEGVDHDNPGGWARTRIEKIGLVADPWRNAEWNGLYGDFKAVFDREPYPSQVEAGEVPGQLAILESETGSGKTEAALWRFIRLFRAGEVDGLYFALPTRTAAAQLHRRVEEMVVRLWPQGAPPVVLAVPGYLADGGPGELPPAADEMDRDEGTGASDRAWAGWAAEHPKRYFAAPIAVGTVDQALMSTLRVKHAHLRGSLLLRHLLVVDEVHSSDPYMRRLLAGLLRGHLGAGGHALLLSATLGAELRHLVLTEALGGRDHDEPLPTLAEAVAAPYPLLSLAGRTVDWWTAQRTPGARSEKEVQVACVPWLDEPSQIAEAALASARQGAKVLVVRNTVAGALAVQEALEGMAGTTPTELFVVEGTRTLHHGRFAREDRRLLDQAVERALGKDRREGGLVVVGTQTLEQSLDIDADFLLTDLCPMDVLLQRIGRLHRHRFGADGQPRDRPPGFETARAHVLAPPEGLSEFLAPRRPGGRARHGLGVSRVNGRPVGVYGDLTVLALTQRLIEAIPRWQIPAMNRHLVEHALHPEAVEKFLASLPGESAATWREHRITIEGDSMAKGQVASDGLLRRHRGFMEQPFDLEIDLGTRLGANDLLIELPLAAVGPFGKQIRRLAVPGWLFGRNRPPTATEIGMEAIEGAFLLRYHGVTLQYDRLGLRPMGGQ